MHERGRVPDAARVTVDAPAGALDLGQSARVYLPRNGNGSLSVPLSALQRDGGRTAVFVVDASSGIVKLQPVQTGPFGEDRVPVKSGLSPDAWVVAAGGHLLRDGLKVQPVDRDNRPVAAAPAAASRSRVFYRTEFARPRAPTARDAVRLRPFRVVGCRA